MNIEAIKERRALLADAIPILKQEIEKCKNHITANLGALAELDRIIASEQAPAPAAEAEAPAPAAEEKKG